VVLGRDLVPPGTGRVEGLPRQAGAWSGVVECRRYRWGPFESTGRAVQVQVPASATGSGVAFDLVLADVDGPDSHLVAGDARWGWSTGASMPMAAATVSDLGLRGLVLSRPAAILHPDADPSSILLNWDCLGEQ
jgi:hypothetical protein